MESYFLSDIHLKSVEERNGQILLRFLRSLKDKDPQNLQVFLLGDIFDLWVSDGKVFVDKYKLLTDTIGELTTSGVKIYFFEGNHDLHIHPYWKDVLNVEVFVDPKYFEIDQLKVRLEHGDLINLEDTAYLKLRGVLRHPWTQALGHFLPGVFWQTLGEAWSPRSRRKTNRYAQRNEKKIVEMIRKHVPRAYAEKSFDLIITGHMHVRDDAHMRIAGHEVRSINLGSWFDDAQVLRLANGQIEWLILEDA